MAKLALISEGKLWIKNENLPKLGTKYNRKIEHIILLTLKLIVGYNNKRYKQLK